MDRCHRELPTFEILTAFPQMASRLGHKTDTIRTTLVRLMGAVLVVYPLQALWPMVYLMQSNRPERKKLCGQVTSRTLVSTAWEPADEQQKNPGLTTLIKDAERFAGHLLRLCNDKVEEKRKEMSIEAHYPYMKQAIPTQMMVPLQDALTGSLPSSAENLQTHNPFPIAPVAINGELLVRRADLQGSRIGSTSCSL